MAYQFSLLQIILLSSSLIIKSTIAQQSFNEIKSPECLDRCGNIRILYPFGIGSNCALNSSFLVYCDNTSFPNKPFLSIFNIEVLGFSRYSVQVHIPPDSNLPITNTDNFVAALDWTLSGVCTRNSSTCGANAHCTHRGRLTGHLCVCESGYEGNPFLPNGCQDINECERDYCGRGYQCENLPGRYTCSKPKNKARMAFIGIGASVGGIFLLISSWLMYNEIKKRINVKLKKKLFKRNGGLLLQQQLASGKDGTLEKTKLFTSEELVKATDHYNEDRILGQGGQGTVYKGMLTDGRIVAIKMSKTVDEGNLEQFINEVVILSQINHRNVVKLHGCCLETEVPLLVYEFIPNGTLSQYIYDQNEEFPLLWDVRLRIATEVAAALSYLHCAASAPIYHRDMKSTNILLEDKYRAKVADFGTSRSIAIDQTHLTTRVLGTFGYLDPEYFQTGQFTEKSDVYSFGVVLVELLTGQKAISSIRSEESRSLATYFIVAMNENNLFNILDPRVERDGGNEEIIAVAKLAKRCLSLEVKKRPTMKEVAIELEGYRMSSRASKVESCYGKVEYTNVYFSGPLESTSSSTFSFEDSNVILDV
ncbi:hypothetical protein LguiB_005965 [Lonicera macranthoides]